MERRGAYNKRRDGHHGKNVNSYRFYHNYVGKWRLPITIVLAFVLVFSLAPMVGEEFQVSVLNPNVSLEVANTDPLYVRKSLLNSVKTLTNDCDRLNETECVKDGEILMSDIVNSWNDQNALINAVIEFDNKYLVNTANTACDYDLRAAVSKIREGQAEANVLMEKYKDVFATTGLAENLQKLDMEVSYLEKFVESCVGQ